MTKKVFELVTAIVGAVAAVGAAVVAFLDPNYAPAIVAAIGIGSTATTEILSLFLKAE